ncbi:hypothetical protein G5I_10398 [Acromyrmex echinatior]|uniref:Uncharacterized protein n=1 Tax=Acromyrmex echinatior TaxID=103372 RepID=F4WWS8_ACREC|nr:hypothetical protein G5I_10398 [Acromyrmex echinatior]
MKRKREEKTISGGVGVLWKKTEMRRTGRRMDSKGLAGLATREKGDREEDRGESLLVDGKIASPVDFTLGRNVSNRSSIYDSFVSGINPKFEGCYAPGFRVFLRSTRNDQTMCAILIAHCVHVALMWLDQLADVYALSSATGITVLSVIWCSLLAVLTDNSAILFPRNNMPAAHTTLYAWPPTMRKLESNSLTHDEGENKTDSTLLRMMAHLAWGGGNYTLKEKIGCCSKLDAFLLIYWYCDYGSLDGTNATTQECNEIIDTAAGCNPTTSRGLLLHIVNGTQMSNYAVRYLDLPASSSWFFFVPRRGALISSSRAVAELDDSGGVCRGYTQLSPRIEQRASKETEESYAISSLVKRGCKPFRNTDSVIPGANHDREKSLFR